MSLCFSLSLSLLSLFIRNFFQSSDRYQNLFSNTAWLWKGISRTRSMLSPDSIILTIFFRNYYRKFCGILWNWRKSKYLRNYDYNVTEGEENRRTTLFSFAILVHSIDIVNIHFLTWEMGHGREFRRKFRSVLSRHLLPPSFFNFTKLEIIKVFARL